jgi:heat shock protein HspQ
MVGMKTAKFRIGQVVRHRLFPFRGVIFDVDPEFNNTEEWYQAIPAEVRPRKDQPFYHLLAENSDSQYIAYVSEQNLLDDSDGAPPGRRFTTRRSASSSTGCRTGATSRRAARSTDRQQKSGAEAPLFR